MLFCDLLSLVVRRLFWALFRLRLAKKGEVSGFRVFPRGRAGARKLRSHAAGEGVCLQYSLAEGGSPSFTVHGCRVVR